MSRRSQAANAPVRTKVTCSICDPAHEEWKKDWVKRWGGEAPGGDGSTSYSPVDRKLGIRGVPDTYTLAAEKRHRDSGYHKGNESLAHLEDLANGSEPRTASVTARLLDFTHGKDHNG